MFFYTDLFTVVKKLEITQMSIKRWMYKLILVYSKRAKKNKAELLMLLMNLKVIMQHKVNQKKKEKSKHLMIPII